MHSCKATQELIEAQLNAETGVLPEDLFSCEDCRREFYNLKALFRSTRNALVESTPSDEQWQGYHQRLRMKLETLDAAPTQQAQNWLHRLFFTSIRIPVPVGVAVLLLFIGVSIYLSRTPVTTVVVAPPKIVELPVPVPVVQEKVVTRVVYRDRKVTQRHVTENSSEDSVLAQKRRSDATSLTGFKPLDDVKLTVIKGGSPDEK